MTVDWNMNQLKIYVRRKRKLPVKSCECVFVYLSKADQKPQCSQSKYFNTAKKNSPWFIKRVRRLKKFLNKTDLHWIAIKLRKAVNPRWMKHYPMPRFIHFLTWKVWLQLTLVEFRKCQFYCFAKKLVCHVSCWRLYE